MRFLAGPSGSDPEPNPMPIKTDQHILEASPQRKVEIRIMCRISLAILLQGGSMTLDELVAEFARGQDVDAEELLALRVRLLGVLRGSPSFVEVAPEKWDLDDRYDAAELAELRRKQVERDPLRPR